MPKGRGDLVALLGLAFILAIPLILYAVTLYDLSGTLSGTSGTEYGLRLAPTVTQGGTAAYTGLMVDVSLSTSGTGPDYIARFQGNGTTDAARVAISYSGTDTVDPLLAFQLAGSTLFSLGIDDSDGDSFKIGTTALDTSTALSISSTGFVTFTQVATGVTPTDSSHLATKAYVDTQVGSGGEANTASNLGGGVGAFASKSGVDLQFKSVSAGSTKATVTDSGGVEVSVDVAEANLTHNNLGGLTTGDPHTQYVLADGTRSIATATSSGGLAINNTLADGDPIVTFQLDGSVQYTMGVDDSTEGDYFRIGTTALDTGTAITISSTGEVQLHQVATGVTPTASEHLATKGYVDSLSAANYDHGGLQGLADDDHTQYILADGTRPYAIATSSGGVAINNTAATGDPIITFQLDGNIQYTMGVDDDDGDQFKIGTTTLDTATSIRISSSQVALSNGNTLFTMTADALDYQKDGLELVKFLDDGSIWGRGMVTANHADLAEFVVGSVSLDAGDVVVVDPNHDERVIPCEKPYDTSVLGVISSQPGFLLRGPTGASDVGLSGGEPLALAGRVPCKVTLENGPIRRGDLLTTSSTTGHAMKAVDPSRGGIIGTALQEFTGEDGSTTGRIVIFCHLQAGGVPAAGSGDVEERLRRLERVLLDRTE
jgi:hypothetical protein